LVLHQLRWLIGDENFFQGIRNYLSDSSLAYGFAGQEHFKYHMEKISNLDLDDYFNDWIYGEGYPIYDITWSQVGKKLKLDIKQSTSHPSVNRYDVPLEFLVQGAEREDLIRVPITDTVFTTYIDIDFKVKTLQFDPHEWLL